MESLSIGDLFIRENNLLNRIEVSGKTYDVKNILGGVLKGKWDGDAKVWYYTGKALDDIHAMLLSSLPPKGENTRRKSPQSEKCKEIQAIIAKGKRLWNKRIKKLGLITQRVLLKGACVESSYIAEGERTSKYHIVVKYVDPDLEKYAEEVVQYLTRKGLKDTVHKRGCKIGY